MRAIAMLRIDDHVLVLIDHVNDVQLDTHLFRRPQRIVALGFVLLAVANGVGMALDTKAGKEIDPLHMDARSRIKRAASIESRPPVQSPRLYNRNLSDAVTGTKTIRKTFRIEELLEYNQSK